MCSSVGARAGLFVLVPLVLGCCLIPSRAVAQIGGHELELGINGAYVEFADGIRFQDDVAISAYGLARFTSWLSMGLEMSWIGAQDEIQQIWQDIVIATARARVEPFGASRFSPGLLLGVSFMAFQDAPALDAISEEGMRYRTDPAFYRAVCDFIAGMTDKFVFDEYEKLYIPGERV